MDYKKLVFALNKIGMALSVGGNLSELLELMVEEIINICNCDGCSIFLKEGDKLNFKTTKTKSLGTDVKHFDDVNISLEVQSIAGYAAQTIQVVNVENCYDIAQGAEYRFNNSFDNKAGYRTVSTLAIPMTVNGLVIGVLQLINKLDSEDKIIEFSTTDEQTAASIASQAAVSISNVRLLEAKQELNHSLVLTLSKAIESRSPHTGGHSERVSLLVSLLAQAVSSQKVGPFADRKFSEEEMVELHYSALLHDIGKISIPESILDKRNKLSDNRIEVIKQRFQVIKLSRILEHPCKKRQIIYELDNILAFIISLNYPNENVSIGSLKENIKQLNVVAQRTYTDADGKTRAYLTTDELTNLSIIGGNLTLEERKEIQNHVKHTEEILSHISYTDDIKNLPLFAAYHHERLDGGGYPHGVKEDEIPLQARILAIADVFESITSMDRSYRRARPMNEVLKILENDAETGQFDKDLVELFIKEKIYEDYKQTLNEKN